MRDFGEPNQSTMMNENLHYKKLAILGTIFSVLMFALFIWIEEPILSGVIICGATITLLLCLLSVIEVIRKMKFIEKKKVSSTLIFLLIAFPVLFTLIGISYHFAQSTRIDIVNNTNQTIDHWSISGCDNLWRDNHYPKQKEIIWLDLSGDCSVEIEYSQNGIRKKETIVGNLKPSLFSKVEFYIQETKENQ